MVELKRKYERGREQVCWLSWSECKVDDELRLEWERANGFKMFDSLLVGR